MRNSLIPNMRIFPVFVCCALVLTGCAPTGRNVSEVSGRVIKPTGAPNFTSRPAGFAVWFPVKVTDQKRVSETTQWGKCETFIIQAKTEFLTYVVVSRSIPSGVDTSNPAQFVESVQDGFFQTGEASLEKTEVLNVNGMPGREFLALSNNGEITTRERIYFSPKFSLQIMAVGPSENIKKQKLQVEKVFDSFRSIST